jgi:hypothetical protein
MGASVNAYWPGITEEQLEEQPEFRGDSVPWGNWMAERERVPAAAAAVRELGAEALLTLKTDGWDDEDVDWVTPQQLREAAERLRAAVEAKLPETQIILDTYSKKATKLYPVDELFIGDLEDIIEISKWAEREGATVITLEVGF